MKYLVIGDAGSMHIYNFVKNFLLPRSYEVLLFTLSAEPVKEVYKHFYEENGVHLFSIAEKGYGDTGKKDLRSRARNLLRKFSLMREVPRVDVCHVQSVYKTSMALVLVNRGKFKRTIFSFWGGDIEDRSKKTVLLRKACFSFADAITVTVKKVFLEFWQIYGEKYDDKLFITRFATEGLDCIKRLKETKTRRECRKRYGIPDDKVCITCGYSAYADQHQDLCLEKLMELPDELRQKIMAVVPMQYGRADPEYIERVEARRKACDFKCVILDKFVPFEVSAELAVATDIYVHVRDTDAFSNALKEQVYADSFIVKGDWLKYYELEEMKPAMTSISAIDQLPRAICDFLENWQYQDQIRLFDPIYQLYSTESINQQWQTVLDSKILC